MAVTAQIPVVVPVRTTAESTSYTHHILIQEALPGIEPTVQDLPQASGLQIRTLMVQHLHGEVH